MAESNRLHSINSSRILRAIWLNPGVSRIKVAELLDLDRSTVTKIMQVIMKRELVVSAGKSTEQSGVGRRQISLLVNGEIGVVLGIEIQNSRYRAVVTTLSGTVLHSFAQAKQTVGEDLVPTLVSIIRQAKRYIAREGLFLLGVGVGLPGIVDPYSGVVIRSNPLKILEPLDVRERLERLFEEHVFLENDANCCCWGELAFRPENRSRNFLSVLGEFRHLEQGSDEYHGLAVGVGLVIRGRVLHGDHFTAGEYRSPLANRSTGQFVIPWSDVRKLPEDTEVLRRVYAELTANLAFLVNCVDFTKILFAGELASRRENLAELMASAIEENWTYDLERPFVIEFSANGDDAVCIGAAGLFVEKLFSVPDVADRFHELVGYDLFETILERRG